MGRNRTHPTVVVWPTSPGLGGLQVTTHKLEPRSVMCPAPYGGSDELNKQRFAINLKLQRQLVHFHTLSSAVVPVASFVLWS